MYCCLCLFWLFVGISIGFLDLGSGGGLSLCGFRGKVSFGVIVGVLLKLEYWLLFG